MAAAAQPRRGAILLPAISAHRGGCETAPAGTMRAYREALAAGADYLDSMSARPPAERWSPSIRPGSQLAG
jgi:hypothetical protein